MCVCMHVYNDTSQHTSLNTSQPETSPNNTAFLITHAPSKQPKLMRILFLSPLVKGWTGLIIASEKGHLDVVRALLEHGANVNAANKQVRERDGERERERERDKEVDSEGARSRAREREREVD